MQYKKSLSLLSVYPTCFILYKIGLAGQRDSRKITILVLHVTDSDLNY